MPSMTSVTKWIHWLLLWSRNGSQVQNQDSTRTELCSWTFHNSNKSIWLFNVTIPGTSHTHLQDAKLLSDPNFKQNELLYQWIPQETWTYSTNFSINPQKNAIISTELMFECLDGPAAIYINDRMYRETHSSFLSYRFLINDFVKNGTNSLRIVFYSPLEYTAAKVRIS